MFFNKQFNILAVDDEPDVLTLTKLLLRDVEVYGLPINLETARSKAEAIEILEEYAATSAGGVQQMISVVLIDVVMETDQAGLELCDFIRNEQNNFVTQLFIRTGQPGTAPERSVIDEYDINGYFTKSEMDESKLYSIVKSGIRQANTLSNAIGGMQAVTIVAEHAESQDSITGIMNAIIGSIGKPEASSDDETLSKVIVVGVADNDQTYMGQMDNEEFRTLRDRLAQQPRQSLNEQGDYAVVDGKTLLIHIAESPTTAETDTIIEGQMEPSPSLVAMQHLQDRLYASLWKRAGNGHS